MATKQALTMMVAAPPTGHPTTPAPLDGGTKRPAAAPINTSSYAPNLSYIILSIS